MPKSKWEDIDNYTERMSVYGGWLIKGYVAGEQEYGIALCFIPDPDHIWRLS